jgi:hypothetical protein
LWRRLFKLLEFEVYGVLQASLLLAVWPQQFFWLQHWHVAFWLAQPQGLFPLQVRPLPQVLFLLLLVVQPCKVPLLRVVLPQVVVLVYP